MTFENMKKMLSNAASTTAKKAGEQVKITRLELSKSGLQKEIDGLYAEIGRCCFAKVKEGADFGEGIAAYCGDIDALNLRISQIENEIAAHRLERDNAQYAFSSASADGVEIPIEEKETPAAPAEDEAEEDMGAEVLPFPIDHESVEEKTADEEEAPSPDEPQPGAPSADPIEAPDGPAKE